MSTTERKRQVEFHKKEGWEEGPKETAARSDGALRPGVSKEELARAMAGVEKEEDLRDLAAKYLTDTERAKLRWTEDVEVPSNQSSGERRFDLAGKPIYDESHPDLQDPALYVSCWLLSGGCTSCYWYDVLFLSSSESRP